jgi:hypothetical protein
VAEESQQLIVMRTLYTKQQINKVANFQMVEGQLVMKQVMEPSKTPA